MALRSNVRLNSSHLAPKRNSKAAALSTAVGSPLMMPGSDRRASPGDRTLLSTASGSMIGGTQGPSVDINAMRLSFSLTYWGDCHSQQGGWWVVSEYVMMLEHYR